MQRKTSISVSSVSRLFAYRPSVSFASPWLRSGFSGAGAGRASKIEREAVTDPGSAAVSGLPLPERTFARMAFWPVAGPGQNRKEPFDLPYQVERKARYSNQTSAVRLLEKSRAKSKKFWDSCLCDHLHQMRLRNLAGLMA